MTAILHSEIDLVDYSEAVDRIFLWVRELSSRYVCAANAHMLMEAHDSPEFRGVVDEADMVVPDGMPLVWILRRKGHAGQQRVYGPTLMLHVLSRAARDQIPVGFYGGSPEVLDALVEQMQTRYEGLNVSFQLSPPFEELTFEEDMDVVRQIHRSSARILFVGLGCPKQERWMAAHRGRVSAVMIGVGAAFDFHAGSKPQASAWIQRLGLEWLFRLLQEPRRLWKRYLIHNPRFAVLAVADLLGMFKD